MKKKLHTPEGVRDIYNVECGKKLALESRLKKVFHLYGYHDIQTPTIEYFDVFREEIGTTPANDLYKFFDKDGNTLVLRPDITPSIARASATLFKDENLPIRLCYTGNTFVNHSSYQGRLRETTQMGAEFVGDDSVEADAEMLALVIESMLTIGLKEFQLCIGGIDILEKAENLAPNSKGVMAIRRLEKIYHILRYYGVEKFVTFDLSMTGTYGYYTGIVFRGYTYGTGDAVVKGGRYDHLIEKFGKKSPSIGFAIVIDELVSALTRQKIRIVYPRKNTIIVYAEGRQLEAIRLAKDFRRKAKNAELLKKDENSGLEDYIRYGNDFYAGSLVYIEETGEVTMVNLVTGEQKIVNSTDRS